MNILFPHKETWLHRLNPTLKLLVFLALFVVILLIHNLNVLLNVTVATLLLFATSTGHPWKRLLLYSSPFLLIFISTSAGMIMFGQGTTTWFRYGWIHITEESFYRGIHLGVRALNLASSSLLFSLTTKPVLLFYSLMQQGKLPPKFAYSFLAGLRMVPIIAEEFIVRRQAIKIRGVRSSNVIHRLYTVLNLYAIPLLAQSIRRAQRTSIAMQAKRFSFDAARTYYYKVGFSWRDLLFVALMAAIYAAGIAAGQHWPYFDVTDVRLAG